MVDPEGAGPKGDATYEDLIAVSEPFIGELVDGQLIVSPRPAIRHSAATMAISVRVSGALQFGQGGGGEKKPPDWWFLFEPELHFGSKPNVVVPDLAGWRRERLPARPDTAFITLSPDWVCEVVSPSTARVDRVLKMALYSREGVRHLWLVDPIARTLEVYRLDDVSWVVAGTYGGNAPVRVEPFDTVELDLSEWWLTEHDEPKE